MRSLSIQTIYYRQKTVVKRNRAGSPLNAIAWSVIHMRRNDYEATHVEVFDLADGKLHSVMKRSMTGNLQILFERRKEKD